MWIVHVFVTVKPEAVEAFAAASAENARHSLEEEGVVRFDVLQQRDDPTRFVLVEVYRSEEDAGRHKQTLHYARWRDAVAPMMAAPRSHTVFANTFPPDAQW